MVYKKEHEQMEFIPRTESWHNTFLRGEGERKRERENSKQAPCPVHSPVWGLISYP